MLRPRDDRPMSLKQQIEVLYGLGICLTEIAEILGRTSTYQQRVVAIWTSEGSSEQNSMARAREQSVEDLLRDLMIVQLLLAGVGQHQIRQIVGVDIHRVKSDCKIDEEAQGVRYAKKAKHDH